MEIEMTEVRIDTFTLSNRLPVAVRVTHMPTGIITQAQDISPIKARKDALQQLADKLDAKAWRG